MNQRVVHLRAFHAFGYSMSFVLSVLCEVGKAVVRLEILSGGAILLQTVELEVS